MDIVEKLQVYREKERILVVDDDDIMRQTTMGILRLVFEDVDGAHDGISAMEIYRQKKHTIVISDITMPGMNGIELAGHLKDINREQSIIMISGYSDSRYLMELINIGVDTFLNKPFGEDNLLGAVEKIARYHEILSIEKNYQQQLEVAVARKTRELEKMLHVVKELSEEIVLRLSTAAEYRDIETGLHIQRLGLYAAELAKQMDLDEEYQEAIRFAAPLHDIGKIGIPDNILLKAGTLTAEEFEIMKTHSNIGAKILANSQNKNIQLAESVALTHHERWDGTGYPNRLKGQEIPLAGRIVTICDQYDALRSERPYKPAFTHEKTCGILLDGDGRSMPCHFDPVVLEAFRNVMDVFDKIFNENE